MKTEQSPITEMAAKMAAVASAMEDREPKFKIGDYVYKPKGSEWSGRVVGTYATHLTPEGYCVESEDHYGSVQIYPAAALEKVTE